MLPQSVLEIDRHGNVLYTNLTAKKVFQYTRVDFETGVSVAQLTHPDDLAAVNGEINKVLKGGNVSEFKFTAVCKDGTHLSVLVYANPIMADNVIVGARAIILDITNYKKAEEA